MALDTDDYDYAQQVDMYRLSLRQVRSYVDSLVKEDNSAFRSSITGYSFSDLSEYAKNVSSVDLDKISSYISVNNVTKNKDATLAYYDYRIENLTRDKDEYAERLAALNASIAAYQKDTITIYGENTKNESTVHSDQYDSLFRSKTSIEASLAQTAQDIKFYESRREALKSNKTSSTANVKSVEADLTELRKKVDKLIELTELTANDYYENVQFANAYTVLAYATKSIPAGISQALSESIKKIIIYEILIFAIYLAVAVIASLKRSNRKAVPADADDDDDDEDEEENDLEDVIDAIEEAAEKTAPKQSSKKNKKK
jgi:large-conductance mechanosensitive channel